MRAMVLKAPRELHLAELELPPLAGDDVRVRVTNSAICGTDLKIYKGDIPVRHPLIMGHEMCGEVVEGEDSTPTRATEARVGSPGSGIRRGDRVMIDPSVYCGTCFCCHAGRTSICPNGVLLGRDRDGGFAEYMTVPDGRFLPCRQRWIAARRLRFRWLPHACTDSACSTFFRGSRWSYWAWA